MRGMNLSRRGPRTAALIGAGLVCAVLVTGCGGAHSAATVCPAGRDLRDLESSSEASSTATIAAVNNLYMMLIGSRPPGDIKADWQTTTDFMKHANTELQALDDPGDQVAFERAWKPLAAELTGEDTSVGQAVTELVAYTAEHCSATEPIPEDT